MEGIRARSLAVGRWLTGRAGWCLAGSVALYVLTALTRPSQPLDLSVYRGAAPHLFSGGLYDFAVHTGPPIPVLPFTYPPFAALLFVPLAYLPWDVVLVLWRGASVAALLVVTAGSLRLLSPPAGGRIRDRALLWAAAGLWLEPVRHTLDQGQINLLLGAVVVGGLALCRTAVGRGAAVGIAASVKLTPAVGGLYLLATRQWRAAAWAAVTGAAVTALAWCVSPGQSWRYWTSLVTDTSRVGPVWTVRNQSLRGALTRLLGPQTGASPVWWAALALVTLAAVWALLVAVRQGDRLGVLVAVQLYGLLVCPISWSHHWIWCVPAMIRLAHGPRRRRALSRVALALWALVTAGRLVPRLSGVEDASVHSGPYPALLAWPGTAFAVCAVLTFLALAAGPVGRRAPAGTLGGQRSRERADSPVTAVD
ncbi:glycosyltransferase 87 family protein [Streptomyces sp. NPDC018610]|uniref:glycosyltransferase 87 family protein n=1 Tax=Streptomyces sp. NPDC018610 TaxID=3365049 RepID=UPI0037BD592E